MTQSSTPGTSILTFQPGLAPRVAILAALFFLEKVFLGNFVDFHRAQTAQGLGAVVRAAQHWGFRFAVAFAAAVLVFGFVRAAPKLKSLDSYVRTARVDLGWILAHVLSIAILVPLTYLLYRDGAAPLPFSAILALWAIFGASAVLAANLVRRILLPIIPTLTADASTRVLATDRFAVEITEVCSGLEGMGLMLAFTVAWLLYFRREYIFPRALLLIPAGLAAMFALNVLRIATLMLIGYAGFSGVAAYGFHSQAGWIAFNSVACGLAFVSRRSSWFNHTAAKPGAPAAADNPTAAYLVPLLAILAAGAVSQAASNGFETLYPLRLMAGLCALALYRSKLTALDWHWSWRGPAVGVLVFLVWMVAAHFLLPEKAIPEKMAMAPATLRGFWIVSRIAGSTIIVPIAEELAYRGYLMRRLVNSDFESVPFHSVGWLALTVTAAVFGLAHGALCLPGIVAGLANALIAASVLGWNQWQLW